MPLLARMLLSPLFIDIRAGAVTGLGELLSDRRISSEGHVAVAVGPGQGEQLVEADRPGAGQRRRLHGQRRQPRRGRRAAGRAARQALRRAGRHRRRPHPRRREVRRHAARRCRWCRWRPTWRTTASRRRSARCCTRAARAPSASACRSRWWSTSTSSVRRRRAWCARGSATWSATCRRSTTGGWPHDERGEPVDGLAVTFARTAAEAILHRTDGIDSDWFLTALAESLVLSGMAMAAAGSSRPCSGADHEILHAVDVLFPGSRQPRRAGRCRRPLLVLPPRRRALGRPWSTTACAGTSCRGCRPTSGCPPSSSPRRSCWPPRTRPDRYTILEHLDLDPAATRARVDAFVATYGD